MQRAIEILANSLSDDELLVLRRIRSGGAGLETANKDALASIIQLRLVEHDPKLARVVLTLLGFQILTRIAEQNRANRRRTTD